MQKMHRGSSLIAEGLRCSLMVFYDAQLYTEQYPKGYFKQNKISAIFRKTKVLTNIKTPCIMLMLQHQKTDQSSSESGAISSISPPKISNPNIVSIRSIASLPHDANTDSSPILPRAPIQNFTYPSLVATLLQNWCEWH